MKRPRSDRSKWTRLRRGKDDPERTVQYTPQDHQSLIRGPANGSGVLRPDTGKLNLPANYESLGEGRQTDSPYRVTLFITVLALIFIAIIAYFISQMPPKP